MSEKGDKTCPLCAEEMDLTDQQLKPCKCGYEICVWCWHHIMDMAEKDETEGRCPACRTPYNKEKIVGMTAKCERLVAEINTERKLKTQKAKSKTSEGRKQLSNVRVIQRNLVYIVGLPLNLADEDLLQHKEYFGQYGKVLKVSISRTATGSIQQSSSNTCSVYITYSKEEEAVRCIQCVHGFVLEDKALRACFGTTKYCHAWLRNMPCSNPDCLYLHEFGSQEDSFTKDEIVSAHTRSRVQQITGSTNDMQRRSGNVLPPPADDYGNNSSGSSGKPITKCALNPIAGGARVSPPNSSSGRSLVLPAAASWGTRCSNSQPLCTSSACSDGPTKQKPDSHGGSIVFATAVSSSNQLSTSPSDVGKKLISSEEDSTNQHRGRSESLDHEKQPLGTNCQVKASSDPVTTGIITASSVNSQLHSPLASDDNDISVPPQITQSFDISNEDCDSGPKIERTISVNGNSKSLCSDMASLNIERNLGVEHFGGVTPDYSSSSLNSIKVPGNQGLQHWSEQSAEYSTSGLAGEDVVSSNDICVSREQFNSQNQASGFHQVEEEDVLSFDDQRLKDPEVSRASFLPNFSHSFDLSHHSMVNSSRHTGGYGSNYSIVDPQNVDKNVHKPLFHHSSSGLHLPNGYPENLASRSSDSEMVLNDSLVLPNHWKGKLMGRLEGEEASLNQNGATDMGESSIISNILSMDPDAWNQSFTSPQSLARLLGKTDKQQESLNASSSWKVQNSNQSRFSFARQEDPRSRILDDDPYYSNIAHVPRNSSVNYDLLETRDSCFHNPGRRNGFSSPNVEGTDSFAGNNYQDYSNKFTTVSRSQISAPPGFSVPSRAPPPGFKSQERVEHTFDTMNGNHMLDDSFLLRTAHQAPPTGIFGSTGDIELMDPAILAVGRGSVPVGLNNSALDMGSGFPSQLSALESEARLQLLLQRSFSPNQNHRFADNFVPSNDAYGIPARHMGIMDQSPASNLSQFSQLSLQQSRSSLMSNGHWNNWNEIQNGNDLGMAELLRAERLGYNKLHSGYDDSKFRMPSSGDLYNRNYGI